LRKSPREIGLYNLRQFIAQYNAYLNELQEQREQNRILAYFSCFAHLKNGNKIKIEDLYRLPGEKPRRKRKDQSNKKEVYELLKKWDKK
jgi:hypothetical protein